MAKYIFTKDTKVFEVIASSSGFDFTKYVNMKKGDVVDGEIKTVPTGYAPKTELFFKKDGKPYSTSPSNVEVLRGREGGIAESTNTFGNTINKIKTPAIIVDSLILAYFGLKALKVV